MAAHAHAETAHHGPPPAHQSSRVDARTLGMFLFIASETMLFGSFFTAYFFVRVTAGVEWPTPPYHLPVFVAGVNTAILVTSSFTMHWALQSIKRGNRAGLQAGLRWAGTGLDAGPRTGTRLRTGARSGGGKLRLLAPAHGAHSPRFLTQPGRMSR